METILLMHIAYSFLNFSEICETTYAYCVLRKKDYESASKMLKIMHKINPDILYRNAETLKKEFEDPDVLPF